MSNANRHVIAIFGGACAGSTAADILAAQGVEVVVFEQNARPYGKIEDGLPRWHRDQRRMEYKRIDSRLDRPGVHFVPRTRLGTDIQFDDVVQWGFSAVSVHLLVQPRA
jgi:NADPH-dependent glutamate synthase beta subunit-like oxidoreductase